MASSSPIFIFRHLADVLIQTDLGLVISLLFRVLSSTGLCRDRTCDLLLSVTLTSELGLFRKCERKFAAPNSVMTLTAKHHTRQKDPLVASSHEGQAVERRWRQVANQQRLTCVSKLTKQTSRQEEEEEGEAMVCVSRQSM